MKLLSIKDLSLKIGETKILRDVDLHMNAGEVVAITGESGSGKSMTALSVMGLLPQAAKAAGQITLDGVDILNASEPELCDMRGNTMGMVFQEPMTALNPVQTIGAQVAETILIHERISKRAAHTRAAAMLQRVGLTLSPDRYPHELSGGQRQRVVIAMAIVRQPTLLIADEPTTALDVTTQAQILDLLRDLVRELDMGLLIITHDLAVVADIADHIVVMQQGRVVEAAPTAHLLANMQHPYTKALFAASTHQPPVPDPRQTQIAPMSGLSVQKVVRTYPPWHLIEEPPKDQVGLIAQALEDVGLAATDADKYIHEFSGGQRQRIAIARALIVKPELIIFDEAVSALDVSVRAQVLDLIADISARRDLSFLFISHDLTVVRSVTDRILVMKEGEIVEQGDTETVFTAPRHAYTKALLAAAPQLPDLQEA